MRFLIIAIHVLVIVNLSRAMNASSRGLDAVQLSALQQMCPLGNVCHTTRDFEITSPEGQEPCCATCSCHDDCQTVGKCCLGEAASQAFLERPGSQCTLPITKILNEGDPTAAYIAYFMVDRCPADSIGDDKCGDIPVTPWGSLQPVYSPTNNKSYKNKHCAECHNAIETIPWESVLKCDLFIWGTNFIADMFKETNDGIGGSPNCYEMFYNPNKEDEYAEICYYGIKKKCPEFHQHTAPIHNMYNITYEEVKSACKGGFISPYTTRRGTYLNPFCAICHNQEISNNYCSVQEGKSGNNLNSFTMLLDHTKNAATTTTSFERRQEACVQINGTIVSDTCRPVLCPSAQTLSPTGSCRHIGSKWAAKLTVNVKLASQNISWSSFPSSIRDDIINYNIEKTGSLVYSPIPEKWLVLKISLAHFGTLQEKIEYLACYVSYTGNLTDPATIVSDLQTLMETPWNIQLAMNTVTVVPEWLEYSLSLIPYTDGMPKITRAFRHVSFVNSERDAVLNKLILCDQIQLAASEFILNDGPFLFYKTDEKVLLEGLYSITKSDDGKTTARVCVDDTDMITRNVFVPSASCHVISTARFMLVIFVSITMVTTHP